MNTFRAILEACGTRGLLELCEYMEGRSQGREGRGEEGREERRKGGRVAPEVYRLLLQRLDDEEGEEGLRKGWRLLAKARVEFQ